MSVGTATIETGARHLDEQDPFADHHEALHDLALRIGATISTAPYVLETVGASTPPAGQEAAFNSEDWIG